MIDSHPQIRQLDRADAPLRRVQARRDDVKGFASLKLLNQPLLDLAQSGGWDRVRS
jgi:hypothetical protein